jgi:hypothetical protein
MCYNIVLFLLLQVTCGLETGGFERLIDPLKYHRCVITVCCLFFLGVCLCFLVLISFQIEILVCQWFFFLRFVDHF